VIFVKNLNEMTFKKDMAPCWKHTGREGRRHMHKEKTAIHMGE
jgi:hypothetical protein